VKLGEALGIHDYEIHVRNTNQPASAYWVNLKSTEIDTVWFAKEANCTVCLQIDVENMYT
jgi:hypothetical protein